MVHFWERVGWPYGHVCVMFVAYWIVYCGHFGLLEGVWGHVRQVLWKGCILECVGGLFDNSLGANNYIYTCK